MMPWGHLAVGYLFYSLGTRLWHQRAPESESIIVLVMATQVPDLIDKPLNWWFSIYDGRAIGHSLLFVIFACGLVFYFTRDHNRDKLGIAFSIGMVTHLIGDSYQALLTMDLNKLSYLLWPFRSPPTYPSDSFLDHLQNWTLQLRLLSHYSVTDLLTSSFGLQLILLALLFFLWAIDGFPGPKTLFSLVSDSKKRS